MSTVSILIVNKAGEVTPLNTVYSLTTLHKKCGFKSANGFEQRAEWKIPLDLDLDPISKSSVGPLFCVGLFAKITGPRENVYEFPAPVDSTLFFGNCALVGFSEDGIAVNLTDKVWTALYEHLFGGFEDLEDIEVEYTKSGYVKDGFVVDDKELLDVTQSDFETESEFEDDHSQLSEESYETESDSDN